MELAQPSAPVGNATRPVGRPTTIEIADLRTHTEKFVTTIQLAIYIGVSVRTIYHHIEKGALHARRIGGVLRIPLAEARRYVGE